MSAQREPEAQRLWRAPLSPWPWIWSRGRTCRWLLHAGRFCSLSTVGKVKLPFRPHVTPGRKRVFGGVWLEVCWEKNCREFWEGGAHGRLEEGAGSAGVGDRCLRWAPRRTMGAGRCPPPPSTACLKALPVPSSPTLGWQEESELFCQTESLPSSVWMRWLLYLAEEVSRHHRRQVYGATGDIVQGNLCQNDKENDRKPQNIKTKDL